MGNPYKNFICGRCLISSTNGNTLINHEEKCGEFDICTNRTSSESCFYWKNHFHKNPIYFRIIGDFGADNEIDKSSIGIKTTTIYKQNPVCNGNYIISELEDVLKSG